MDASAPVRVHGDLDGHDDSAIFDLPMSPADFYDHKDGMEVNLEPVMDINNTG